MKKINTNEIQDMTFKQAEKFFGKELLEKIRKTGLLDGITCRIVKSEIVVYAQDWKNAFNKVVNGKTLFWDQKNKSEVGKK